MNAKKWGIVGLALIGLTLYNETQPGLLRMREMPAQPGDSQARLAQLRKERYGPSLEWLDRLTGEQGKDKYQVKLDFRVLSSMMIAGLASGFRSQVANLLWMKSDEYWHQGLLERQVPLMEAVVTLDPQFTDAWSTVGWHWAYNIYADEPDKPQFKHDPIALRKKQRFDIETGLDYLDRGIVENPDTYRLYFENAWTRTAKLGVYDEKAVNLLRIAHSKPDARTMTSSYTDASGKEIVKKTEGMDLVGRNIGHIYEQMPDIPKALKQYRELLRTDSGKGALPTDEQTKLLLAAGEYWGRYGSSYAEIVNFYNSGDATTKAQIRKLIPDVERMVAAHNMRNVMGGREPQATGAFVSLTARYLPAWKLKEAGKTPEAINTILGVMNAVPKYHLQGLPVLARVLELRGDSPAAIKKLLDNTRQTERDQTQEIGLHLLARLYEQAARETTDPKLKTKHLKDAYETWYRARERSSLNFYARRNAQELEDTYHFTPPQAIIEEVNKARSTGHMDVAPPPNVQQYADEAKEDHKAEGAAAP